MAFNLSPLAGAGWQFFDDNGDPLTGGKLYTYSAGTTTPLETYTSVGGGSTHTNPIILNAAGRIPDSGEVWLLNGLAYKFVLKTSTNVQIWSADNIVGVSTTGTVNNFTGNGIQTTFTLSDTPNNENSTQVYISGVYQQKNTYALVNTDIVFSEAPPLNASVEILFT